MKPEEGEARLRASLSPLPLPTVRQTSGSQTARWASRPRVGRRHHTARSGTAVLPATAPCPPQPHPHPHPISRYRLRITLGVRAACLSAMWLNLLTATAGSVVSLSFISCSVCVCVKYRVCWCKWICEWAWTCVCVCMCVLWVSTHNFYGMPLRSQKVNAKFGELFI